MLISTLTSLPAFALLLLVSENVLSVTAAPHGYRPHVNVNISVRSPTDALFERGVIKPKKQAAAAKASQPWKASNLKTSDYRKTALSHNDGAYVKTAGGSQVKWQKGAKGDAGSLFISAAIIIPADPSISLRTCHRAWIPCQRATEHTGCFEEVGFRFNITVNWMLT